MLRTRLEHLALLYVTQEDFLGFMVPYVSDGLAADEVVFVAAKGDNLAALRAEIGDDAGARWADTEQWHPHPGTRLRAFYELVSEELTAGAAGIRLAGEPPWPDGPPELILEWQRYESVLNRVLAPFPTTLVCLYDAAGLDKDILDTARRTHPTVTLGDGEERSSEYVPPEEFLDLWNPEPPPPPAGATGMARIPDLSSARHFLSEQAARAGVGERRAMDLCLAVNEVLTNAIVHGGGNASLSTWTENGRFVCHIEDLGDGIDDPLAGYRPPEGPATAGYGLWIARQLVDLLQVVPGRTGTVVRLHMQRA